MFCHLGAGANAKIITKKKCIYILERSYTLIHNNVLIIHSVIIFILMNSQSNEEEKHIHKLLP